MSQELLDSALKDIMTAIAAERGSLFVFDSRGKELVLNSFYNSNGVTARGLKQKIGEGVCGKAASIKVPILVKDIKADFRFKNNGFNNYKTNSFISIPLFTSEGLLGMLNFSDKASGDCFSQADLQLAVNISKYVCAAVDNINRCKALKNEKEASDKHKTHLEKYASVGKLAAGITHEINNPLDGVIRYVNMCLQQLQDTTSAYEYLAEAKKGLRRIANITKSLLEFSHQVNLGKDNSLRSYIGLHKLIDDCLDSLIVKPKACISVIKKYAVNPLNIADLGISHVIMNLIKNSLDAMSDMDKGVLEVATYLSNSDVMISVRDTGIGIPANIHDRIFDPFFTTKAIDKGTGLGLAICNEVVKKYDGRIEAQSVISQGTTFTVHIPRRHFDA